MLIREAVKNLFENTCQGAFEQLLKSTHDVPFAFGPYGESFCALQAMFIGSVGKLEPQAVADVDREALCNPLPNEPHMTIDWTLPLTPEAQTLLFCRVRSAFDRVSWMIPATQKKKYRLSPEELNRHRNMVALFSQLIGHLRTQLPPEQVESWITDVREGVARDEDLLNLLHLRPPSFAMSMLLSEQDRAKRNMEDIESKKVELVAKQREEATQAQWSFFVAALKQDQGNIEKVQSAPRQVRQRLHVKQVAHRSKMVKSAETGCLNYQDTSFKLWLEFQSLSLKLH